jgi:hypothetical protein
LQGIRPHCFGRCLAQAARIVAANNCAIRMKENARGASGPRLFC